MSNTGKKLFKHLKLSSSLEKNLRLIALARLVLLVLAQFFVLLNQFVFAVDIQLLWAELCLLLLALSVALTFFQLKHIPKNLEKTVKVHLVSDVVIMSLLFHVTGGAANPFVSILLFPLVISASILHGRFSWLMVILTLSCYGSLFLVPDDMAVSHNMPHHLSNGGMSGHHSMHENTVESAFSLHIIGMWFNFAISAILISFFVVRMRQEIEIQQQELVLQREQSLRDEQLLGVATQAASAAHHLGTPLSTMSVILHDLENDDALDGEQKQDISLLASQVAICKNVLSNLRHQAENERERQAIPDFISILLDEFRLLRPQAKLTTQGLSELPKHLSLVTDSVLRMAILNLLNNAADASPESIEFHAYMTSESLTLDIVDFGESIAGQVGLSPVNSSKKDGLGLGLFLSHATINRFGGEISVIPLDVAGKCLRVEIPLDMELDT